MFDDIMNNTIDYKKEWNEAKELLKEAKYVIQKERARRYALEDLNNESYQTAKKCAKTINDYRDKYGKQDFDDLDERCSDIWDTEDEED